MWPRNEPKFLSTTFSQLPNDFPLLQRGICIRYTLSWLLSFPNPQSYMYVLAAAAADMSRATDPTFCRPGSNKVRRLSHESIDKYRYSIWIFLLSDISRAV